MSIFAISSFLRRALLADAIVSGASGLLMFGGASFLTDMLALPEALLRYAGLILLPYSAYVAYVATREHLSRTAVLSVIAVNALWTLDSIALLLMGWVMPNALGYGFVIAQALVVAAFAEAQYIGMQRQENATA